MSALVGLTLTFVRSPRQPVSGLPGPVVVERSAALAVITCSVVSAHTLSVDLRERTREEQRTEGEKELISNKEKERMIDSFSLVFPRPKLVNGN